MEVPERLAASILKIDQEVSEELMDGLNETVEAGRFWNCASRNIKMGPWVKDTLLEVGHWVDFLITGISSGRCECVN